MKEERIWVKGEETRVEEEGGASVAVRSLNEIGKLVSFPCKVSLLLYWR